MEIMANNLTGAVSAFVAEIEKMMNEREEALREELVALKAEVAQLREQLNENERNDAALMAKIEAMSVVATEAQNASEEVETPVIEFEPIEESEPEVESKEESVFAPADLDSASAPAPAPELEEIEGNKFDALFEKAVDEEEFETIEAVEPVEPEPAPMPEPEPMPEPVVAPEPEPEPEVASVKEEPVVENKAKVEQPSLFDYLGGTPATSTLAEKIAYKRPSIEEQLESHVSQKKVDDLRQVININDKFSFMNELFHNNMKAYNDFIMKLNAIQDREEGLKAVEEIAAQYSWDATSLAVRTFYKYFDRKF